ncbi:hypothetical protein ACGFNY_39540 [Streptomyces chartreusis]|uniref:hypothetical protein n=1 Tax=Streptomyces chartreusis TaxID=1969 RepID=UPI00372125A1
MFESATFEGTAGFESATFERGAWCKSATFETAPSSTQRCSTATFLRRPRSRGR